MELIPTALPWQALPAERLSYFLFTGYAFCGMSLGMDVLQVYKCLCDGLRLRILNVLAEGPLCVCHLMEILGCDQVRMSKQLRYMKALGMVEGERRAQWMVYRLADPESPILLENLKCLQDCADGELGFAEDLRRLAVVMDRVRNEGSEYLMSPPAAAGKPGTVRRHAARPAARNPRLSRIFP